jgi:hypothetical protein
VKSTRWGYSAISLGMTTSASLELSAHCYNRFSALLAEDRHVSKLLEQVGRHGALGFRAYQSEPAHPLSLSHSIRAYTALFNRCA